MGEISKRYDYDGYAQREDYYSLNDDGFLSAARTTGGIGHLSFSFHVIYRIIIPYISELCVNMFDCFLFENNLIQPMVVSSQPLVI